MDAFEQAIERGEIDLDIYGSAHDELCWLVAFILLPENDEIYAQFRNFMYCPDDTSNKAGRRNIEQAMYWLKSYSADDLLPRLQHIASRFHPDSMAGKVEYQVQMMRGHARWLLMMNTLYEADIEDKERTPEDDFGDYYRKQREARIQALKQQRDDDRFGTISP